MKFESVFDRLGLPKHSAEVYLSLEKNGPSSISAISRDIAVFRPAVYRAVRAMVKTALISEKDFGMRTYFAAEGRKRVTDRFVHEIEDLSRKGKEVSEKNSMGAIRYFEGKHSVTLAFNDLLEHSKRGDTFYRYTSERDLDAVNNLLPPDYRRRRDAKRLERLVISNPESGKQKRNRLERFIKYISSDREAFDQNAIQLIYGDRLAFIDLNTYKGFIIENHTLAEFQKTIFKALYKRL